MYQEQVMAAMHDVFHELPTGVAHTRQVLAYAEEIMDGEGVDPALRERTAIAAILHDIGVLEAQRLHGSMAPPHQEAEGARVARQILERLDYDADGTARVSYLVGHHHTAAAIDGLDFQILWEADLLVNLAAMPVKDDPEELAALIEAQFTTPTGRALARRLLLATAG